MDDRERELDAYRILRGDTEVGALACYPDTCEDEIQALTAAGLTVRPMEGEEVADLIQMDTECTEDSHESCDISVAAAWIRDLAEDAGTDSHELTALIETGYSSKEQVLAAMETVRDRLPESVTVAGDEVHAREEADMAIVFARDGGEMPQ